MADHDGLVLTEDSVPGGGGRGGFKVRAESDTLIKFSKPYVFEGQTYTEIDLAGLENLTARDMIDAEKYLLVFFTFCACHSLLSPPF